MDLPIAFLFKCHPVLNWASFLQLSCRSRGCSATFLVVFAVPLGTIYRQTDKRSLWTPMGRERRGRAAGELLCRGDLRRGTQSWSRWRWWRGLVESKNQNFVDALLWRRQSWTVYADRAPKSRQHVDDSRISRNSRGWSRPFAGSRTR